MKGLKYNPDNMKYLGKPIDYVVFDNNKVVFLEVKTGSSQLNDNEINLKRLIDNKQVYYEVIRI
jgi:predicted Holliday junction resolvase-like endonuclease